MIYLENPPTMRKKAMEGERCPPSNKYIIVFTLISTMNGAYKVYKDGECRGKRGGVFRKENGWENPLYLPPTDFSKWKVLERETHG